MKFLGNLKLFSWERERDFPSKIYLNVSELQLQSKSVLNWNIFMIKVKNEALPREIILLFLLWLFSDWHHEWFLVKVQSCKLYNKYMIVSTIVIKHGKSLLCFLWLCCNTYKKYWIFGIHRCSSFLSYWALKFVL